MTEEERFKTLSNLVILLDHVVESGEEGRMKESIMKEVVTALEDPSIRIQNVATSTMREYAILSPDRLQAIRSLTKLLTRDMGKETLSSTVLAVQALRELGEAELIVVPGSEEAVSLLIKGLMRAYLLLFDNEWAPFLTIYLSQLFFL